MRSQTLRLKKGEQLAPGASISDLLRLRNLQHIAPMLDSLGVEVPSDLRFIYVEDLIEEGISYVEAIKLLQGYQSYDPFILLTYYLRAQSFTG